MTIQLTYPVPTLQASDSDTEQGPRQLAGVLVPYGTIGRTSAGPVRVQAGAIQLPDKLSRIKLTREHDRQAVVGYLTAAEDQPDALRGTFALPRDLPSSQLAFSEAQAQLRDGLSVELDDLTQDGDLITSARLVAVSQVSVPAFEAAGVTELAAAQRLPGNPPHPSPTPPRKASDMTDNTRPTDDNGAQADLLAAEQPTTAVAMTGASATPRPADPAAQWAAAASAVMQRDPAALSAALSDVTAVQVGDYGQPQYLGGLWDFDPAPRPMIEASTQRPLTSTQVKAWKWTTRMAVDSWNGDKSAIPSTAPAGALDDISPTFMAGGVDVAREFVDLGSPELLRDLFSQAVDDYRRKTELTHAVAVLSAATTVAGATDVVDAMALAASQVQGYGQPSAVFLGSTAWVDLIKSGVGYDFLQGTLSLSSDSGNVGGLVVGTHATLNAKQVLVFDRRAVVHLELNPPVRVNAVNVANGGMDQALHGYRASYVRWADAVAEATYA